jgi:CzcA family heavy metal efflux pump
MHMDRPLAGGLAAWSIRHPIGVVMITLAVVVLGIFSLERLGIDLLPHIIYPEVRVRVDDPGVPASIMEDQITRQLEEQLAITEDAIHIQSRTTEGRSSVDLAFEYGKDIDIALRDASTRLDRAKRFLPDSIRPPTIYKRDPSQLPMAEFVISSPLRDPVELRSWTDYSLSKWLLNLPGVAAAEVGGGLVREIQVVADQQRLAGLGLDVLDLEEALTSGNLETAAGRLTMERGEISGRTAGRFQSTHEIGALPIQITEDEEEAHTLHLEEVAEVIDGAEEERLRVRLNGLPGVKLSIQKQPQANTVAVVDRVMAHMQELKESGLIPEDIEILTVDDQARYVRKALNNAQLAAGSGAILAMLVVYLFLGSLRRTLIIGSAIPIAILVTFILMAAGKLTLNIMTLGGLALGIGMLVDSTIVMLENIYRHQRKGEEPAQASGNAAAEVNSAIIAATSTNLAAVLPFLFIGGLIGLLFQELIFTISAAIVASMVVALTLVPALAGHIPAGRDGLLRQGVNRVMEALQRGYGWFIGWLLHVPWLIIAAFIAGLAISLPGFMERPQIFLPDMDEGRITLRIKADRGINVDAMDQHTQRIEQLLREQPEVDSIFTIVGGSIFGRSQYEAANRATIQVRLRPVSQSGVSSGEWIGRMQGLIQEAQIAGTKVFIQSAGIRGIQISRGDDDISLRIQGPDLEQLERLADQAAERLKRIEGLRNVEHSQEDTNQEMSIRVDRERAARFGLSVEDVGRTLRFALEGIAVTDFIDGDRGLEVRLRLDRRDIATPEDMGAIILFSHTEPRVPLRLGDIAHIELVPTPASIMRDRQQRVIEITASLTDQLPITEALKRIEAATADIDLPAGYTFYEAGNTEALQEGQDLSRMLLGLALFLVFVVMAVQYESLRNPLIIMLSVPFAAIGVVLGLEWWQLPISMPIWLGVIMLAGIVVNNAIVLVEYIEIERRRGLDLNAAITSAARLRLRPILMTTLTTVVGMLPLALALGEGSEMLQPLAVTIVCGLLFSTLVSLLLVPSIYRLLAVRDRPAAYP